MKQYTSLGCNKSAALVPHKGLVGCSAECEQMRLPGFEGAIRGCGQVVQHECVMSMLVARRPG